MSLLDVDSWSRECEACSALNHAIVQKLEQSEKRQKNSIECDQLIAAIQVELKQFEGEVKELMQKLDILQESRSMDPTELSHRKQQVDVLQRQLVQVGRRATQVARWEGAELFAQASHSGAHTSSETTFPATERLSNLNDLKQQQVEILERQNRGLEALSQTISRQKGLASQLGQEVESQNDILDNLADTMDRVDTRVHLATGNISEVNRKDSTWGYWLVIITLFVAILVVAVI